MNFNVENMNSISNINSTFVRDKNGDKVYLFDKVKAYSSDGKVYEAICRGFCIHQGEFVILVWDTQFFTPDHIEKIKE